MTPGLFPREIDLSQMKASVFGVRTGKEAVELHQELEIDIVALGSLPMGVSDVMAIEIDT